MLPPARLARPFPVRLAPAAWCADRLQAYPVKIPIKNRGYVSPVYNIGFPSLSVQTNSSRPPRACAMACNSWTVKRSRRTLLDKFCGLFPVALARSASDNPARLHNILICSLVFNSIAVNPPCS